jgi:hypothetical protein
MALVLLFPKLAVLDVLSALLPLPEICCGYPSWLSHLPLNLLQACGYVLRLCGKISADASLPPTKITAELLRSPASLLSSRKIWHPILWLRLLLFKRSTWSSMSALLLPSKNRLKCPLWLASSHIKHIWYEQTFFLLCGKNMI